MNNKNEFDKFLSSHEKPNPGGSSRESSEILQALNPNFSQLILKLTLVQLLAGLAILSFCPQLGLGFFPNSHFAHILMSFGEVVCNLFCGSLFVGAGMITSTLIFNHDEVRVLKKYKLASTGIISTLSLVGFVLFGAKFELIIFGSWFLGALVSGVLGLQLGGQLKLSFN